MNIAGREYPTPLVVGGVAGVLALVVGQRFLHGGGTPGAPDPAAAQAAADAQLAGAGVGQFPADGSGSDWWDPGAGGAFPPAGLNDPGLPVTPTPVAPNPVASTPTPVAPVPGLPTPTPAPAPAVTHPAGTAAKAIFPAGTYKTAVVSGGTFVRYGAPLQTGGFSAWAAAPVTLRNGAHTTTWFRITSSAYAGKWFYRFDPNIRWQPV